MSLNNNETSAEISSININIWKEKALYILGEDYYSYICDFFKSFIKCENYKFKIIKTRRAYVLFRIIFEILSNNDDNGISEKQLSNIYTDIFTKSKDFRNKIEDIRDDENLNILIIDDILIHGRSMCNLIESIKKISGQVSVNASAIMVSEEAESKPDELCSIMEQDIFYVSEEHWKDLSNRLVSLILSSSYCYASFVDGYRDDCIKEEFSEDFAYIANFPIQLNTNDVKLWLYYKEKNLDKLFSLDLEIVRRYEQDGQFKYIVPFYMQPTYDVTAYLNDIPKLNFNEKKAEMIFSYKYNTYVKSKAIISKFEKEEKPQSCKKYSFGNSDEQNIFSFNEVEISNTLITNDASKKWSDALDKIKSEYSFEKLCDAFKGFVDELHKENEKRARNSQERLDGLSDITMLLTLKDKSEKYNWNITNIDYIHFLAFVISMWDSGQANYNVTVFTDDGKYYIGGCITDGEQAYISALSNECSKELQAVSVIVNNCYDKKTIIKKIEKLSKASKENQILSYEKIDFIKVLIESDKSYYPLYLFSVIGRFSYDEDVYNLLNIYMDGE